MRNRITIFCIAGEDAGLLAVQAAQALANARAIVVDDDAESVARAYAHPDADVTVLGHALTAAKRLKATRDAIERHADVVRVVAGSPNDEGMPTADLSALASIAQLEVIPTVASAALDGVREWREKLPLHQWHVLVPRTKDSLDALTAALERDGAQTTHVSTLSVEPPRTPQQMQKAVTGLVEGRFGWIVFTSANAFTAVWERCREYGLDARAFAGMHIAAVGQDTLDALETHGLTPDLPSTPTTLELLDVFPEADGELVSRVLIPRADIATETLATGLQELGWEVEEVTAFRTVRSAPPHASTRDAIKHGGFDAVVFTSSATVRNLIGLAGKPHAQTLVACIGPSTAKTAEEHGLRVDAIAAEPTHASLVEALVNLAFADRRARREAAAPRTASAGTARRKAK